MLDRIRNLAQFMKDKNSAGGEPDAYPLAKVFGKN